VLVSSQYRSRRRTRFRCRQARISPETAIKRIHDLLKDRIAEDNKYFQETIDEDRMILEHSAAIIDHFASLGIKVVIVSECPRTTPEHLNNVMCFCCTKDG
jgi:hypothetical protein